MNTFNLSAKNKLTQKRVYARSGALMVSVLDLSLLGREFRLGENVLLATTLEILPSYISNTKESSLPHLKTARGELKFTTRCEVFSTNFEVFGNAFKHCLEYLIYLLQSKLKEKTPENKSHIQTLSQSRFPLFKLGELLMSLRS